MVNKKLMYYHILSFLYLLIFITLDDNYLKKDFTPFFFQSFISSYKLDINCNKQILNDSLGYNMINNYDDNRNKCIFDCTNKENQENLKINYQISDENPGFIYKLIYFRIYKYKFYHLSNINIMDFIGISNNQLIRVQKIPLYNQPKRLQNNHIFYQLKTYFLPILNEYTQISNHSFIKSRDMMDYKSHIINVLCLILSIFSFIIISLNKIKKFIIIPSQIKGFLLHTNKKNTTFKYPLSLMKILFLFPLIILCSDSSCTSRFTLYAHVCILSSSKQVKCWGKNDFGNLGIGDSSSRGNAGNEMGDYLPFVNLDDDAISIRAGGNSNCVLLLSLQIKCFGYNVFGQLGYGDVIDRGDDPNEMGSYLPLVNLGSNLLVSEFSVGSYHNVILFDSGKVKSFGNNDDGQLGYGDVVRRGDGPNEMGDYIPFVSLGTGLIGLDVQVSRSSSCILFDNLDMKCWGVNGSGQLGKGNAVNQGDDNNEMGDNLSPIILPSSVIIDKIRVGWDHIGMISKAGSLYLWGYNSYGQLGIGSTSNIGDGSNEMGDYLIPVNLGVGRLVLDFGGGNDHSCVILDNFEVKCWGRGDFAQLGYGDTDHRGDNPNEIKYINYQLQPKVNL